MLIKRAEPDGKRDHDETAGMLMTKIGIKNNRLTAAWDDAYLAKVPLG